MQILEQFPLVRMAVSNMIIMIATATATPTAAATAASSSTILQFGWLVVAIYSGRGREEEATDQSRGGIEAFLARMLTTLFHQGYNALFGGWLLLLLYSLLLLLSMETKIGPIGIHQKNDFSIDCSHQSSALGSIQQGRYTSYPGISSIPPLRCIGSWSKPLRRRR